MSTSSIPDRLVRVLIASVQATLLQRSSSDDPIAQEARRVLQGLAPALLQTAEFEESQHPIVHIGASATANPCSATSSLVEALRPVLNYLPWQYSYPERADAPALGERIAFAEIIGPAAPWISPTVCVGFTLIAPHTNYPPHHHPATELYYVLAGNATWSLRGVTQLRAPGTFILHPSEAEHAMRTNHEPLLALYTWSGTDVRTTSVYV
jgi:mannose-6-phosphate isomerase-like protein (cupin superfamily)